MLKKAAALVERDIPYIGGLWRNSSERRKSPLSKFVFVLFCAFIFDLCFCLCLNFCLYLYFVLFCCIGGLGRNSSGRRTSPLVNRRARSLGRSQRKKCLGRPGPGREKGLEIVTIRGMGPGSWVPPYRQISQSSTWPILWMSNGADDMSALKLIPNNERDDSFHFLYIFD